MNWKNIGPLIVFIVGLLLCAAVAFGQTPAYDPYDLRTFGTQAKPACAWYYWKCDKLSPTTKRKLYEHDPTVCHCAECRRARLAAGIEYMGLEPPSVYTPPERWQYCYGEGVVYVAKCGKGRKK
jgi:hypothetical protein